MKPWKCSECNCEMFEEVMEGVTQSSVIKDIEAIGDGNELVFDYGNTSTEGGDLDSIRFQCVVCGNEVTIDELIKLAN